MYKNTPWLDQVVDAETQEVIQEGTDQSAANFNNMEDGITDASVALAMLQLTTRDLNSRVAIITFTFNSVGGEGEINYPDGFNHDNCVVIAKHRIADNGSVVASDEVLDGVKIVLHKSAIGIINNSGSSCRLKFVLLRV